MGGILSRSGASHAREQAKHIDTNVRQQQAHTPGDQRAREPGGDDVTSTPPSGMRPGDASGRPPVPRQASGRKDRPPGLTQTFQQIADSASPEVVPGARLLPADSPSVQSFTKQILEAQAIMGRDEHQFEALAGVGEGEEGLDETEAETSLATLEEEFNHSLSSAEIRIIGSVKRWQRGNLLGSGSYGRVYMAMNSDSGEIFVVKQVPFNAGGAGGPGMDGGDTVVSEEVAQLEMEIALLGTLSHPNIVKYLGTERNNLTNELSIFLEHMPGGSIAELVAKFGKLDESVIRKYTREVLEGLIYLHDRGIIHRDIKGQNILVDNHGSCKLADFGASRFMQSADSAQNMSFKGTPVFMSPEVIQEQRYSKKSDIWSVGCTVLQMATGNPPFSEFSNHIAALFHITSSTEPPPLPAEVSQGLRAFALQCFERDVKQRPNAQTLREHPYLHTNSFRRRPTSREATPPAGGGGGAPAHTPEQPSSPTSLQLRGSPVRRVQASPSSGVRLAADMPSSSQAVDTPSLLQASGDGADLEDDADAQFQRFLAMRKQTTKVRAVLRRGGSGRGLRGEDDVRTLHTNHGASDFRLQGDAELGMAERSHSFNSDASSARKDENSVTEAEAAAKAADELLGAPPRGNLLRGR